ncbi:MAG: hypothetical protein RI973_2462 [Bacteroidota bacterium]|jgi:hypothetical protein
MNTRILSTLICLFLLPVFSGGQPSFQEAVKNHLTGREEIADVGIVANIKTRDFVKLVQDEFKRNPLKGETSEVSLSLFPEEEVPRQNATGNRTKPQSPTSSGGFLDAIEAGISAVGEFYDEVVSRAKTYEAGRGKVNYTAKLKDLSLQFRENNYAMSATFDMSVQTKLTLNFLPESFNPRQNLNANFQVKIDNSGQLVIENSGAVSVKSQEARLKINDVSVPKTAISAVKIGTSAIPFADYMLDKAGKQLEERLEAEINRLLSDAMDAINLKQSAETIFKELDQPIPVESNGFAYPNITALTVAQLNGKMVGKENVIEVAVGLRLQPFATFEARPVPVKSKANRIAFGTQVNRSEDVNVTIPVFLSYDFLTTQFEPLTAELNEYLATEAFKKKYKVTNTRASHGSSDKLRIEAEIRKRKNDRPAGTVYFETVLSVRPADTAICVVVTNVKVRPSDFLIRLAKGAIEKAVYEEAAKQDCLVLGAEIRTLRQTLDESLRVETPLGILQGKMKDIKLHSIAAQPRFVLLRVGLNGNVKFE